MKKFLYLVALSLISISCSSDDDQRNNPYLVDLDFSFQLDLSLPQYNNLNFPGNSFTHYNYGINGVVVYNLNNSQFLAFELTDPNHVPSPCSVLQVEGINAFCGCEDANAYSIITGQLVEGQGEYTLKPYRVERIGNILQISN